MALKLRRPPKLTPRKDAYPYQLDATRAIMNLPYAAIFHEQGLGKTKIAVDLMLFWLGNDLVDTMFVITKKSLVQNWFDELREHSYVTPRVLSDNRRDNSLALNSPILIYITNYEAILSNSELISHFLQTCRVGAILDESHKIKNPHSKLSSCFHHLSSGFAKRVIMTGTPAANRPYDIWSQIKFLDNGKSLGPSFADFKTLADLPQRISSIESSYSRDLATALTNIRPFTVRDTKETAGIELPQKTILRHFVDLAPHQRRIYEQYRDELGYDLTKDENLLHDEADYIVKRLLRLVQCASNPALLDDDYHETPAKALKLRELLHEADLANTKAVVWTSFVANVEWLHKALDCYSPRSVHGRMSISERNQSIAAFKTERNCRVIVATPGTAKEGFTLTVATHAVFYDRGFGLDDYLQAQDRIHRISQTSECYVHNLICNGTIDEWIDTLLNVKHQAAQIAQGDVAHDSKDAAFEYDLVRDLSRILSPQSGDCT